MTVTALSPLMMLATSAAPAAEAAAAPATPTTNNTTRRTHNPYLRAPPTATVAAFAGSLSLSCTAAPSPIVGYNAAATQMLPPSPSPLTMQQPLFPAVVKPQQAATMMMPPPPATQAVAAAAAAAPVMIAKVPHPMRPQQQQYPAAGAMMAMPASVAASSCICPSEMGYPQASSCSGMMMMGSSHAPSAAFMPPQQQQLHQLQPYVQQQQQQPQQAPVSVISHKDLSGSTLRYVRFTALDTTSAAAPRRDRPSGPFQAPAMPPVINEALMSAPDAATLVDVFVSQLPFDLPLQSLRALADAVVPGAPIRIAHAAPHQRRNGAYDGCCFVKMPEADAHRFIAALHKRVLFDVFGLWVADCAEGLEELTGYCAHMQAMRPEARRRVLCRPTPFSAVTAELAKRVYAF